MLAPAYLKKGDKVVIVSTARKIEHDIIDNASQTLKDWGLVVEYGAHLFSEENQFAGSDEERATDFQNAMADPECKAIFCARGGYGTIRIMEYLNFQDFKNLPKWVVGYSDVTVLHAHLQEDIGVESLHATMPINFKDNSTESLELLKSTLFGEALAYQTEHHPFNRNGKASGELVGGNLSILYSLSGSDSFPNTDNRILFIEDLDEYLYHVDRMMMNLKRSGVFENLKALIVGGMSDMNDNEIPYGNSAEEIIRDIVGPYDFPVSFGFPAGHLNDNRPLILGRKVELEVGDEKSRLVFSS